MNSGFRVIIPARYGSQRFPGKPLASIAGKPLIQHVIRRAQESQAQAVFVATDDERIARVAERAGAVPVRTGDYPSGTDRIAAVLEIQDWPEDTLLVNLQGDEPCMPPALIDQVAHALAAHPELGMATLATPIPDRETLFDPHVVKVVADRMGRALYFSRAPIPWDREAFPDRFPSEPRFLRHIGLYAYRAGFLRRFVRWPPAPLEQVESLEQLRVLWQGERIHLDLASVPPGPGVDRPSDVARVLAFWSSGRTSGDLPNR